MIEKPSKKKRKIHMSDGRSKGKGKMNRRSVDSLVSDPEGQEALEELLLRTSQKRKTGRKESIVKKRAEKLKKAEENCDNWRQYAPREWVLLEEPTQSPFVPQIDDVIAYVLKAHMSYSTQAKVMGFWDVKKHKLPWNSVALGEVTFCRVIDIKYFKVPKSPLTYCVVKLLPLPGDDSSEGKGKGKLSSTQTFEDRTMRVTYHDVENVPDFMISRRKYDVSVGVKWSVGERVKVFMESKYFYGTLLRVIEESPYSKQYSPFNGMVIKWDDSEEEEPISPWDLEKIDSNSADEDFSEECSIDPDLQEKIKHCLELIMKLPIAEPFLSPVDGETYLTYYMVVSYPVDLGKIYRRLNNKFYRSISSVLFDIRHLSLNAHMYNEPESVICHYSDILCEMLEHVCLQMIITSIDAYINETLLTYGLEGIESCGVVPMARTFTVLSEEANLRQDSMGIPDEDLVIGNVKRKKKVIVSSDEEGDFDMYGRSEASCSNKKGLKQDIFTSSEKSVKVDIIDDNEEKVLEEHDSGDEYCLAGVKVQKTSGSTRSGRAKVTLESEPSGSKRTPRERGRRSNQDESAENSGKKKGHVANGANLPLGNSGQTNCGNAMRTSSRKRKQVQTPPSVRRSARSKGPKLNYKDSDVSDKSCDFDPDSENYVVDSV